MSVILETKFWLYIMTNIHILIEVLLSAIPGILQRIAGLLK